MVAHAAVEECLCVDEHGHVDRWVADGVFTAGQCDQCESAEVVLFGDRVGGAGIWRGIVKEGLNHAAEPVVENATGLGIELAAQAPHPGFVVDPTAQAGVAALTFEGGDAIVLLRAPDLGAQRSCELGRGGALGNLGEELITRCQSLLGVAIEAGYASGENIHMVHVHSTISERCTELGQ